MSSATYTYQLIAEELEERQRQRDVRHRAKRQANRTRRQELRMLPTRGCLMGNTMSPGTDVQHFMKELLMR